jgi:hypothetical protein
MPTESFEALVSARWGIASPRTHGVRWQPDRAIAR